MLRSKLFGVALTTLILAACDNSSSDPVTPPPPAEAHYLIYNVNDPGQAGVETGEFLYALPDNGLQVKKVEVDVQIPAGSPWNGVMPGMIHGSNPDWAAGWCNINAEFKGDGTWHHCSYDVPASPAVMADGAHGLGFKLAVGGGALATNASAGTVWVDNLVITYTDDTKTTYDFNDGVVPAALTTLSDNPGNAVLSLSIGPAN